MNKSIDMITITHRLIDITLWFMLVTVIGTLINFSIWLHKPRGIFIVGVEHHIVFPDKDKKYSKINKAPKEVIISEKAGKKNNREGNNQGSI